MARSQRTGMHDLVFARLMLATALVVSACGGAASRRRETRPDATRARATEAPISSGDSPFARALARDRWVAQLARDHVLVGRVWSPSQRAFVEPDEVARDVVGARFVLLGEKHDDPDHQRLHVAWIETLALASAGHRRAVVLEMLESDMQGELDAATRAASTPIDPDALARAIDWEESGWPWERYRPVVAAAIDARFALRAGNLSRLTVRRVAREGNAALLPEVRTRLGVDRALPPGEQASLEREMADSHCGMLPAEMLPTMGIAQRARDGEMAGVLVSSGEGGAVLVAGSGHVRRDRGVPWVLAEVHHVAPTDVRAIAYVEVVGGADDPTTYARTFGAETLPFDWVVFTARTTNEDPCEAMRRSHTR